MEQAVTLICTVGSSHQPIVKAIKELNFAQPVQVAVSQFVRDIQCA